MSKPGNSAKHSQFATPTSRQEHEDFWTQMLQRLDQKLEVERELLANQRKNNE